MENIIFEPDEYFQYVRQEIDEVEYYQVEGEIYPNVINWFHESLKPQTYLEIGIADGTILQLAKCRSIGVDPDPTLTGDFSSHLIYTKTSDDFFLKEVVAGLLLLGQVMFGGLFCVYASIDQTLILLS